MVQMRDIRPLTGIRGIAALVVLLYHIQWALGLSADHGLLRFSNGYLAVDLFFVLSGFVLSLNYRSRFSNAIVPSDYASFIGRRLKRLFPLYWVVCAMAVAKGITDFSGAVPMDLSLGNIAANLLMIHAWGFPAERFLVPSWSISAEFVAYFLFPVAVLLSNPFRRWAVVATLVAFALLLITRQSGLGEAGPMDVYQAGSFYPLLRCLAGFTLGMAAHALAASSWGGRHLKGDVLLVALLAGVALCAAGHADLLLIGLVFPLLIINLARNEGLAECLFGNRLVHYLGLISYSIYLIHPLVVGVCLRLAHLVEARSGLSAELSAPLLALCVTIPLAALTYRTVERGRWIDTAARALADPRHLGPSRERAV